MRPTGDGQIAGGWGLVVLSILLVISGALISPYKYGQIDPDQIAFRFALEVIGGGFFGLGVTLLVTGWIIRAIYFLPGREDSVAAPAAVSAADNQQPPRVIEARAFEPAYRELTDEEFAEVENAKDRLMYIFAAFGVLLVLAIILVTALTGHQR